MWNLRVLPVLVPRRSSCSWASALAELVWLAGWVAREIGARRQRAIADELVEAPALAEPGGAGVPAPSGAPSRSSVPGIARAATTAVLTILLVVGALIQVNHDKGFLPYWIKWDYSGYQNTTNELNARTARVKYTLAKEYPEYQALIDTMDKLPPGRALWEGGAALDKYGTPLALMLLPYWTHGRIQSMEGVYFEASATTPYHFETVAALGPGRRTRRTPMRGIPYRTNADFSLGVRYLQVLGVNYFLTSEDGDQGPGRRRPAPRARRVDARPRRCRPEGLEHLPRRRTRALVQPLHYQPVVATGVAARATGSRTSASAWCLVPGPARQAASPRTARASWRPRAAARPRCACRAGRSRPCTCRTSTPTTTRSRSTSTGPACPWW